MKLSLMKTLRILIAAGVLAGISSCTDGLAVDRPVPVGQAAQEIKAGVQLLDVRTPAEWNEGHLKGAKLVTLSETGFADKVKTVIDPGKPVIVYCRSGKRSAEARKLLQDAGFLKVRDMAGGLTAWRKAGGPVVKGPAAASS